MKRIIILIYLCNLCFPLITQADNNQDKKYEVLTSSEISQNDAVILLNEKVIKYTLEKSYSYSEAVITTTFHRKVRINSVVALEKFNKLYIPVVQSGNREVSDIKGATIKQDGTVIPLETSDVKETTLPANIPFLRKVKGKVKLFAFSGLNIDDEIEYSYTVTVKRSMYTTSYFNDMDLTFFDNEYFTKENKVSVTFPSRLRFNSFSLNTNVKFNEISPSSKSSTKSYSFILNNVQPSPDEVYAIEEDYIPGVIFQVSGNSTENISVTWDEELDGFFKNVKKKMIITSDMTIGDLEKKMKAVSGFKNQMQLIVDEINKVYFIKPEEYLEQAYSTSFDGLDYGIYQKIADKFNYKVNFWFVKNRKNGKIYKEFPSLSQFDDVILEFVNPNGNESSYLPLYKPLDPMNYVSYDFNNTLALKVYQNSGVQYEFTNFKVKEVYPENKVVKNIDIAINAGANYSKTIKSTISYKGEYLNKYKINFYNYPTEKEKNDLYKTMKENINNIEENALFKSLVFHTFDPNKDKEVTYNSEYQISGNTMPSSKYIQNLNSLLSLDVSLFNNCIERKTEAYTGYPHKNSYVYTIKVEGGQILNNDLFNLSMNYSLISLNSTAKLISNDQLRIQIDIEVKADTFSKEQWCTYAETMNAMEALYQLPIVVTK